MTPREIPRSMAPLGLIAAWLFMFWAWYECGLWLSVRAARAMSVPHLAEDQMMALVMRFDALRSALALVAFPLSCVGLLWLISRARVWTWGALRTGGFVLMSMLVAACSWYLARRLAPMHMISIVVSAGTPSAREYTGNPLGDLLAYGAIPLMLLTALATQWWFRRRVRRGMSPMPASPSRWTGRDVRILWLAVLGIEVAMVVGSQLGLTTFAAKWMPRALELLALMIVSVPALAAIVTVWWVVGKRHTPAVSSSPTGSTPSTS
ncbi:MAG TPA: hypothetical protein VNW46_11720 [Gemmatimonadaceae bacterium]|jgi:hypothetical protein|nr:hypothetical protein [Gemmatimonadaceae bacterium]